MTNMQILRMPLTEPLREDLCQAMSEGLTSNVTFQLIGDELVITDDDADRLMDRLFSDRFWALTCAIWKVWKQSQV